MPKKKSKKTAPPASASAKTSAPPAAPMLLDVPGARKIVEPWMPPAWFAERIPHHKIDDAFLRRLSLAKFIPAPLRSKWPAFQTLAGLAEWFRHQSTTRAGLPDVFATQKDFAAQTGLPITILDYLRKKKFAVILPGSRVDLRAVLRAIGELGVERIDHIDGDFEMNRLNRERADEQAMLNAAIRGEKLFSQDHKMAIGELQATEVLHENFLAPFKKEMLELAKKLGVYDPFTALLEKHLKNLPPEIAETTEPDAATP